MGCKLYGMHCTMNVRIVCFTCLSLSDKNSQFIFGRQVDPWFWSDILRLQMLTYMPAYTVSIPNSHGNKEFVFKNPTEKSTYFYQGKHTLLLRVSTQKTCPFLMTNENICL